MLELVQDDERLREERKKAKKNREKYVGLDSETASHSRYSSSSYNDYNRNSGGFPKSSTTSGISHTLDDKEWRSNNPSIQERITDITSKVKTMFDVPDIDNNKAGLSDDEDFGRNGNNGHSNGNKNNFSDFSYNKEPPKPKSNASPAKIDPITVKKDGIASKSKTVDNIAKLNIKLNDKKVRIKTCFFNVCSFLNTRFRL
jgi:hypothetical protein